MQLSQIALVFSDVVGTIAVWNGLVVPTVVVSVVQITLSIQKCF